MRAKIVRYLLIGFIVALYGAALSCTSMSLYEKRKSELSENDQKKLDEYRAEIEIGRNMAGRLLQFYGTQGDTELLDYVNEVAAFVGQNSAYPDRRYMVEIIETEMINAFACPGGYILMTLGAVRNARTEAELAGVLGHEIAHVGNKHMFDKLKSMSDEEMDKTTNAAQKDQNVPREVLVRGRPQAEEGEVGEFLAKYLAGGAAGLNFVKAAGAGMAVMLSQGLSPDAEYEADNHGVGYALNAGYDPNGLTDFLCRSKNPKHKSGSEKCRLKKKKKKSGKSIMDQTHPPIEERLAKIDARLKELSGDSIIGASGKKRYTKYRKRLPAKENT